MTTPKKGGAAAQYSTIVFTTITNYQTSVLLNGEIMIKKFDQVNRIISGTFSFDAVNASGEKVQVREGRFDMKYTL